MNPPYTTVAPTNQGAQEPQPQWGTRSALCRLQRLGARVCASTPECVRVRACVAGTEEDTVFWTWAETRCPS